MGSLRDDKKWLSVNLEAGGKPIGPFIQVPTKIQDYLDVQVVVNQLQTLADAYARARMFQIGGKKIDRLKLSLFAYFLGVMIGDAGKRTVAKHSRTMNVHLGLSGGEPSNIRFGEFTSMCANSIGLRMHRLKDDLPSKRIPYGRVSWLSQSSLLLGWIFNVVLSLPFGETTTFHRVQLNWMLQAPKQFKIWFLQGLADSDGNVDWESRTIYIFAEPNAEQVAEILGSLNVVVRRTMMHGLDSLILKAEDAIRLPVFNPHVNSHRYQRLRMITTSQFSFTIPPNLEGIVSEFIKRGFSAIEIASRIADEYHVVLSLRILRRRMLKLRD